MTQCPLPEICKIFHQPRIEGYFFWSKRSICATLVNRNFTTHPDPHSKTLSFITWSNTKNLLTLTSKYHYTFHLISSTSLCIRQSEEKVTPGDIFLRPDICIYCPTWSYKFFLNLTLGSLLQIKSSSRA